MVDTKFLIVTTLCYVGIFVVVLVVCCCAWARYMRNEGRLPPRRTKLSRGRRAARELPNTQQCTQLPPPPRQYRYIGDFTDVPNHQHQPSYQHIVQPNFRPHAGTMQRPTYPHVNHYALVEGYPPRNYYPASLATPTDTYDMDLQMDIGSATFGETSTHGGFSGDDFSDCSSHYNSRQDVSGVASGEEAVLSFSDVGNSLKNANNNSLDTNREINETQRSREALKNDESDDGQEVIVCETPKDIYTVDKVAISTNGGMDSCLVVKSFSEECNGGIGITPSCSVQSLTEFVDEPEHIPLNAM